MSPRGANNKVLKICLYGHFGSTNFGNESTLQAFLYNLRRFLAQAEVTCICTDPEVLATTQNIKAVPISREFVKPYNLRTRIGRFLRRVFVAIRSEPFRWAEAFRTLKGTHMLIIPGTGLLTDVYGLSGWGPYNLFKWSIVAKACNCKLLFVSVGAGPLYGFFGRWLVKSALSLADYRSYRDATSMSYLKDIGFKTNTDRVYPDLVFSLPETVLPRDDNKRRRIVVGLGLMGYAGRYSTAKPRNATSLAYTDSLVVFVRWLLAHDHEIRLLLGEVGEWSVSQEFRSMIRVPFMEYDEKRVIDQPALCAADLLPQIAATDIVVATRFHNVLLALLLNKPVIAISFHHKCASLMGEMGLAEYCHDINQMNAGRLIEQFQAVEKDAEKLKRRIAEKVAHLRDALEEQYKLIFEAK